MYATFPSTSNCQVDEPGRSRRCLGSYFKLETKGKLGFENGRFQSVLVIARGVRTESSRRAIGCGGRRVDHFLVGLLLKRKHNHSFSDLSFYIFVRGFVLIES